MPTQHGTITLDAYYDASNGGYYLNEGGNWSYAGSLPASYGQVDFNSYHPVAVSYFGASPWDYFSSRRLGYVRTYHPGWGANGWYRPRGERFVSGVLNTIPIMEKKHFVERGKEVEKHLAGVKEKEAGKKYEVVNEEEKKGEAVREAEKKPVVAKEEGKRRMAAKGAEKKGMAATHAVQKFMEMNLT